MPGSIQVSVLGLMDVPSPTPLSCLSLKVVVGNREYHTVGGGELSFPVMSLRENLVVVLHDAAGEEILRTELRTMLLLERGFWDDLIPLKDGGSLHMKLQFSLSDEDRKRIREMRDSVLKKRRMENHEARHMRPLSDNRIEGPITKTIAESITEDLPFDHSELTVTDENVTTSGDSSLHVSEQSSEHSLFQDAHYLTEIKDARHVPSQMVLQLNGSSGAGLEKYKYFSPKSNNLQDKVLNNNVKGMINVFESSVYQGVGTFLAHKEKFLASRIDAGVPARTAVMEERSTSNLKFPQTMPKLFSSGMLSQIYSQGKSNFMESFFLEKKCEAQTVIPATNYGIQGSKDLEVDKKMCKVDIGMAETKSTQSTSSHADPSAPSNSSITIDNVDRTVSTGKSTELVVYGGISGEMKRFSTFKVEKTRPIPLHLKAVGKKHSSNFMQKEGVSLDFNAASGNSKARPSSQSGVELHSSADDRGPAVKISYSGNKTFDRNATLAGVNRNRDTVDISINNIEQQSLGGKFLRFDEIADESEKVENLYKHSFLGEVTRIGNVENTSQNPSNVLVAIDELRTGKKSNNKNKSGDVYTAFSEEANRKTQTVDLNESNDEERTLRDMSLLLRKVVDDSAKIEHPNQQHASVDVTGKLNDKIIAQIPSNECAISGSTCEKAGELESANNSVCPNGILSSWTPRHLCITTGSNLLRDFAESFTVFTETNFGENSSMGRLDAKNYGDAYPEGNEIKVLPPSIDSCAEDSPRSLKSNGLIGQVVRIVVVIVACGLLIKNR